MSERAANDKLSQNALSNHGFLPRDGRNVNYEQIYTGMKRYGLSDVLTWVFSYPIFLERKDKTGTSQSSWWSVISKPIEYAFSAFGMRDPGQKDSHNVACLNLDQLALHNVIEHDVSLSRLDFAQGDNNTPQPDLIADILACSKDGKVITLDDFVALRRRRYDKQKEDNPDLKYEGLQLQIACCETSLVLKVFGNGTEVPVEYVKAFFVDGRMPSQEGWSARSNWWTFGLVELNAHASKIKARLGPPGEALKPIVRVAH